MNSKNRHLSQWHERQKVKSRKEREDQLLKAVQYCNDNSCKGYSALATGLFPLIKDLHTINSLYPCPPACLLDCRTS